MKIHSIMIDRGAEYTSHCGQVVFDPHREVGTTELGETTCLKCASAFNTVTKGIGLRGFQITSECPNCGRVMSKASMVKHNQWEQLVNRSLPIATPN